MAKTSPVPAPAPLPPRRRWEGLGSDLLVCIFGRLGVADLLAGASSTCSSWRAAAKEPSLWKALDLRDWESSVVPRLGGRNLDSCTVFNRLFIIAFTRSGGVDAIWFPSFADEEHFLSVAERCPTLHYFYMKNVISEDRFCEVVSKLTLLKGMAVNETLICQNVLQQVSRCCANFSELKIFAELVDMTMAKIICTSLPHLKKLELNDCIVSPVTVLMLLEELKDLEYLDISGHKTVGITGAVLEKASRLKVFNWDSEFEIGEFGYCSDCEQDYFYQKPCECFLDRQVMEWLASQP